MSIHLVNGLGGLFGFFRKYAGQIIEDTGAGRALPGIGRRALRVIKKPWQQVKYWINNEKTFTIKAKPFFEQEEIFFVTGNPYEVEKAVIPAKKKSKKKPIKVEIERKSKAPIEFHHVVAEIMPIVKVETSPGELRRGQLLNVNITIVNELNQIIEVPELWLRILNKDQIVVQKPGLIGKETSGLSIKVGTEDLDEETYTIQVSTNRDFRKLGFSEFKVKRKQKGVLPIALPEEKFIPPIILPPPTTRLPGIITSIQPEDRTENLEVERLKFTTMMDSKVDPVCKSYENTVWDIDDPDLPIPPLHPNCRCFLKLVDFKRKEQGSLSAALETTSIIHALECIDSVRAQNSLLDHKV